MYTEWRRESLFLPWAATAKQLNEKATYYYSQTTVGQSQTLSIFLTLIKKKKKTMLLENAVIDDGRSGSHSKWFAIMLSYMYYKYLANVLQ